ncbi:MAG: transglutaminase-like cysteine peptidase [Desulfovibrionaceae bacterium]|nr:transglutaminase-like cysteine peptidase [Desulfovibrionaceae bacterium]
MLACLFLYSPVCLAETRLFDTVEFRMKPERQQQWLNMLRRNARNPLFQHALNLRGEAWASFKVKFENVSLLDKLKAVNRLWNRWPYRTDLEAWGRVDYWTCPAEFAARSGDCEDYCIAKYFTLRELGVPSSSMRVVVVRETLRNIGHAVLAVYGENNTVWILDNLSSSVLQMNRIRHYIPQYSVNEQHLWMHVRPLRSKTSRSGLQPMMSPGRNKEAL